MEFFNQKTCEWNSLRFLDPPGPRIVLCSKPGSGQYFFSTKKFISISFIYFILICLGNTWTRHILQLVTGIQTGSVYNDTTLKLNGFPGEGVTNGSMLVIKHHRLTKYVH